MSGAGIHDFPMKKDPPCPPEIQRFFNVESMLMATVSVCKKKSAV